MTQKAGCPGRFTGEVGPPRGRNLAKASSRGERDRQSSTSKPRKEEPGGMHGKPQPLGSLLLFYGCSSGSGRARNRRVTYIKRRCLGPMQLGGDTTSLSTQLDFFDVLCCVQFEVGEGSNLFLPPSPLLGPAPPTLGFIGSPLPSSPTSPIMRRRTCRAGHTRRRATLPDSSARLGLMSTPPERAVERRQVAHSGAAGNARRACVCMSMCEAHTAGGLLHRRTSTASNLQYVAVLCSVP